MRRLLVLLAVPLLACSGSPTAPSVPFVAAPVAVVARDGITGEVVPASVQQSGGMVTVTAPGFLTRTQPATPAVYLWRQPEEYVRELVYTAPGNPIIQRLMRWKRTGVRVAFVAGLERHDDLLREHVEELNRVTRGGFVALPAGGAAEITLSVTPSRVPGAALAVTSLAHDGFGAMVIAEIFFGRESIISDPRGNTLLHELGHALGLNHSPRGEDVMFASSTRTRTFTDAEARAAAMMYSWRKAGNTFPDSEPQGLASTKPQTYTIACR